MHLSSFFYRPVVEETFFRTAHEDASNIGRGRNQEGVLTTRETCSSPIDRGTLRPEASGPGSPMKKPIRATAGPCGRNTALRALADLKDGTRSRALSSTSPAERLSQRTAISQGSENDLPEPSADRSRDPSPSSSPDSAPVCLCAGPTRHSQTRRAKRPPACS